MEICNVLLVEDNEGDILLLKEALESNCLKFQISIIKDGESAIHHVNSYGTSEAQLQIPNIIFLDINLPKINGFEVLKHIRNNTIFKDTPVIILSTSSSQKDIELAYEYDASCYITKGNNINAFDTTIGELLNFWLSDKAIL